MKIKNFTLTLIAMCCCVSVFAGRPQSKTDETVEFRPHWDIQLQGGAAYTLGESSKFTDLVSPAAFLSTNYKFHPAMGVRFGLGGWQGKGIYIEEKDVYKYNFAQLFADYKLDLSTLIGGYNHKRVCGVYVFAGISGMYGFNNREVNEIAASLPSWSEQFEYKWDERAFFTGRLGLGLDFRVSKRVNLNLEANAEMLSDHFNSKRADNLDWQFNLLAGVSVGFGDKTSESRVWREKVEAEEAARIAAERAEAERREAERRENERLENERREAERIRKEQEAAELAAKKAAAERAAKIEENSDNVFFLIGSSYIRKAELEKVNKLAEWMKANEDFNLCIIGHADKETGSAKGNMKLSEQRVNNVKKALVKAGIPESRIVADFKGDTVQPFEENAKNRVVTCTLE
ncbi:MAG: OmpA family protein [Alistipes sp.]|nr:OmpA family protein [Alistipes sp.]